MNEIARREILPVGQRVRLKAPPSLHLLRAHTPAVH